MEVATPPSRQETAPVSNVFALPTSVNSLHRLDATVAALNALVHAGRRKARGSEAFDFAALEMQLHQAVAAVEIAACAEVMAAAQPESALIEVNGETYKRLPVSATVEYLSLPGSVEVVRPLYRKVGVHNGPTVDPIALRCGLVEGRLTPAAAVAFAHLAQAVPSREGADLCASLGVLPYSRSAHHRNGVVVGAAWDEYAPEVQLDLVEAMTIPEETASVSVSVDRVSLPMAEDRPVSTHDEERGVTKPINVQLRMAYCAVWTLHDAQGEPLHSVRYAHVPDAGAETIEAALIDDLSVVLRRRPELRLVTLADGAPEMQLLLDRVVGQLDVTPDAQMVDFWHVTEKLGAAAGAAGHDARVTSRRFAHLLLTSDDAITRIEKEVDAWADAQKTAAGEIPEPLYDALTYLANQGHRMRYASARAAGLPVGSGHVEATCKTIVTVRFKRPGARWRPDGAQPLLGLRALATSSRWKHAMKLLTDSYVVPVREAA